MHTITNGTHTIEFELLRKSRLKNTYIEVTSDGVLVKTNKTTSLKEIKAFVSKKFAWITKHLEKQKLKKKNAQIETGSLIYYLGERYLVKVEEEIGLKKNTLEFIDSTFVLKTHGDISQEEIDWHINMFYKQKAMEFIDPMVKEWSGKMDLFPTFVGYRKARTRWGSCSSEDRVSFSYYLMKLPLSLVEYVVVHELAHIRHKNHSSDFWSLVEKYLVDYKQKQEKIREFERLF